ncbi:MAG: trigger factor [Chitinophagales bacterium]|nr:trigger factor [Chitinophagales bacterium]
MATITKESIGPLHEKLTVKLEKTDYLPAFEKALKDYSKKANIPGFRKGMVPASLIKKMYGPSVFTDEVVRSVDRELIKYIETDKLDIFAQPLPLENDIRQLDMNNPAEYVFHFEVGMRPDFNLPDLSKAAITRYKVTVTDEMLNNEVTRLQNRYGNMKDEETVNNDENVLNVTLTESDVNGNETETGIRKDNSLLLKYFKEDFRKHLTGKKVNDHAILQLSAAFDDKEREWIMEDLGLDNNDATSAGKYFKLVITKIGLLEKRELNEDFFKQLYPDLELKTEEEFRGKIREEIQAHWENQARNQIQDQVYHELINHTSINFPEIFLKKWIKTQGENPKTDEEAENEFPVFISQLKWSLITGKIVKENNIEVKPEEIRSFALQQLLGYMGINAAMEQQDWIKDYLDKMMKDRKYVEDAFNRIQTQKILEWAEQQVKPTDKVISAEEFTQMVEAHQHHHH